MRRQGLLEAGEREQPPQGGGLGRDHDQTTVAFADALQARHQDPQSRGIDETDVVKVEGDLRSATLKGREHLVTQARRGVQVELSARDEDRPSALLPILDLEFDAATPLISAARSRTAGLRSAASIGAPVIESLGPVVVTVPADAGSVHVLRAVVASVAARLELSIDGVDEMRIAIDEAAALLLHLHAAATVLKAELTSDADALTIRLSGDATLSSDWPPVGAEEAWPWRVITGLCDEAGFDVSPDGPGVWMRRRRMDADGE